MTPQPVAVIGLGNPMRRDDGIGPAVANAVARRALAGVQVTVIDGDPLRLLDAWRGAGRAVVVDAVRRADAAPGSIHRLDPTMPAAGPTIASSHGLGLAAAVRLARVLGALPGELLVYGVQVADTGVGTGLSPAVAAAVPRVTRTVLADLGASVTSG